MLRAKPHPKRLGGLSAPPRDDLLRLTKRLALGIIICASNTSIAGNLTVGDAYETLMKDTTIPRDYNTQSALRAHPPALARTLGRLTLGHTLEGRTLPTVKGVDGPTWGSIVAMDLVRELAFRISETFVARAHQESQHSSNPADTVTLDFTHVGELNPTGNTPIHLKSGDLPTNNAPFWSSGSNKGFTMQLGGSYNPKTGTFKIARGLIDSNGSTYNDVKILELAGYHTQDKLLISTFTIHFQTNTGNTSLGVIGTRDTQGFLDMVAQTDVENDGIPDVTISYDNQGTHGNITQITVQLDVEGNERGTGDGTIDATQSAKIEHHQNTERRLPVSIATVSQLSPNAIRNLFFLSKATDDIQYDQAFQ